MHLAFFKGIRERTSCARKRFRTVGIYCKQGGIFPLCLCRFIVRIMTRDVCLSTVCLPFIRLLSACLSAVCLSFICSLVCRLFVYLPSFILLFFAVYCPSACRLLSSYSMFIILFCVILLYIII